MKTIFISQEKFPLGLVLKLTESTLNLVWLGLVNQELAEKANARAIVDVVVVSGDKGYNVTYLESEMIPTQDDCNKAYDKGIVDSYSG